MEGNKIDLFDGVVLKRPYFKGTDGKKYLYKDYHDEIADIQRVLVDAKRIPKVFENPIGCQLELTYRCNQRCVHCYNRSGVENASKEELSFDEWKNVCHQLGEAGIFQCVISGGEPTLLGDKVLELMDILHSYGVRFIFISNGMLLDERFVERLAKYRYDWFQVSIDGSRPELHEFVRGVPSWHKAIKAASLVKQAGLPLVIAHAVVKKNMNYLEEMVETAYYLGAHQLTTGPYEKLGRAILNNDELEMTDEEYAHVQKVIEEKTLEYAGRMDIKIAAEEVWSLRMKTLHPNDVMLIRPNGDVKVDCIAPFTIGNVRKNTVKEIWDILGKNVWEHPRLLEYIKSIKKAEDMLDVHPRVNVDPDEELIPLTVGGK